MARNHHNHCALKHGCGALVERTAWSMFVTVSVMTAGERVDCAWTVASLGPNESSRVDLVTRDLDVYVSSQDLELVEVCKSLEFAEIPRRLQDAEEKRVKLRQSVRQSLPEPLVLRNLECRSSWRLGCERRDVSEANRRRQPPRKPLRTLTFSLFSFFFFFFPQHPQQSLRVHI